MIYKKIATELKARINSDDYAVGDMLPSEKALAAELKVSVMTLRKALALLEEEKLIARRHGSGTCIVRKSNYLSEIYQNTSKYNVKHITRR